MPASNTPRIVVAIDPGYDRLGWAVGEVVQKKLQLISYGLLQTSAKDELYVRYHQVQKELLTLIGKYKPSELAIEKVFFSKNTTTALKVAEVRGVCIGVCLAHNVGIFEYNPMTVKETVTGYGKADKAAVTKMIKLQLKVDPTSLKDDTLDALAILLTHSLASQQI